VRRVTRIFDIFPFSLVTGYQQELVMRNESRGEMD
jgi:hypothetical protein